MRCVRAAVATAARGVRLAFARYNRIKNIFGGRARDLGMFERTDVAAACCVAASMLTTGGVPSAEAVAAAHDELADGWARRARRLPARTAAEALDRLAPLRGRVRIADLVDAMPPPVREPQPAADAAGRSLHTFRSVAGVVARLFDGSEPQSRALLWETRPPVIMACLPSGVWAARAGGGGDVQFEPMGSAEAAVDFIRTVHAEHSAPAPCNLLELVQH